MREEQGEYRKEETKNRVTRKFGANANAALPLRSLRRCGKKINHRKPSKYNNPSRQLCALRALCGESPHLLKLLILIDWFAPAYKAGGPIRSMVNAVEQWQYQYECYVLTGTADLGGRSLDLPAVNEWVNYKNGPAKVMYADAAHLKWAAMKAIINELQPDLIYMNSMFSFPFAIQPLLMHRMGSIKCKAVLAPRGMLKASAVQFKSTKKKIFLTLFKLLGIHKRIRFQATDETETKDIQAYFPGAVSFYAPNYPGSPALENEVLPKESGKLDILFIGRIHPVKNLHFLLECLKEVNGEVKLTIAGVLEDEEYWGKCKGIVEIGDTGARRRGDEERGDTKKGEGEEKGGNIGARRRGDEESGNTKKGEEEEQGGNIGARKRGDEESGNTKKGEEEEQGGNIGARKRGDEESGNTKKVEEQEEGWDTFLNSDSAIAPLVDVPLPLQERPSSSIKILNIKFLGPVPPHELDQLYKKHHIFALPTQGENFGHAIFDAFCNGKPVVISDQTPWTQLAEHHAGWEIPLSQKKAFISCLQQAIDWNHSTYKEWSNGAHQLAVQFVAGSNINDQYKKLFF